MRPVFVKEGIPSSTLEAIAHDPQTDTLWVLFKRGAVYLYEGVPWSVVQGLLDAPSAGKYFGAVIRNAYTTRPEARSFAQVVQDVQLGLQPVAPWPFPMALAGIERLRFWERQVP